MKMQKKSRGWGVRSRGLGWSGGGGGGVRKIEVVKMPKRKSGSGRGVRSAGGRVDVN